MIGVRSALFGPILAIVVGLLMPTFGGGGVVLQDQLPVGRIVIGHVGLNSTSTVEHARFWAALGGSSVSQFGREMFTFSSVFISPGHGTNPTGGTEGTTVDHLGFQTSGLAKVLARMRAVGYMPITSTNACCSDELGTSFVGPDGIKVTIVERKALRVDVMLDHIHFSVSDPSATRDWYVKVLGAKPAVRGATLSASLPNGVLLFDRSHGPVVGTKGRVLDHLAFEVQDLLKYCKALESKNVKFDASCSKAGTFDLNVGLLTDPWGTSLELTEGYVRRSEK